MADKKIPELVVLWLEDVPEEISNHVEDLEKLPCIVDGKELPEHKIRVLVAQGFLHFDDFIKEIKLNDEPQLFVIILDIMIAGVSDLKAYFKDVKFGDTGNGYAAGIVFLQQVLEDPSVCQHYNEFDEVPVILYSKRAFTSKETNRMEDLKQKSKREIEVRKKVSLSGITDKINEYRRALLEKEEV